MEKEEGSCELWLCFPTRAQIRLLPALSLPACPPSSISLLPSHHPQERSADVAWSKLPPGMTKKPPNDKPWQLQRGHSPFPSAMYFLHKHLFTVSRPQA